MKKILKVLVVMAVLILAGVIVTTLLTPWMNRWGATNEEIAADLPGDHFVLEPKSIVNRAVTIDATADQIYPWLLQMGAGRGGLYSYTWFETNILRCPLVNADRIYPELQNLQVGDEVKMCPEQPGPVPFTVAQLEPNSSVVLGHTNPDGSWTDTWEFHIEPQADGKSRLVVRTRTIFTGGIWTIINPGIFIMERGMLLGIKERADAMPDSTDSLSLPTPTPEIFIPLDPSPTPSGSDLPLTCQITDLSVYIERAAGFCFAYPPRFTLGDQPSDKPEVKGPPIGSSVEPVQATFTVEVTPFEAGKTLQQQAEEFLKEFTVVDLTSIPQTQIIVGGETGIRYDPVPVMLSWNIVFLQHGDNLYRLMYWPVDVSEASADMDELFQTTINSFAFID